MFKTLIWPHIHGSLLVQALISAGWTAVRVEIMYLSDCRDEPQLCRKDNPKLGDYMIGRVCRYTKQLILKKFGIHT